MPHPNAYVDVEVSVTPPKAVVVAHTARGDEFVDAWIHGVLSVEDSGRVTLTSEVADSFTVAARERGLTVRWT